MLALDQGSSSSRTILYNLDGKGMARASQSVSTFTPRPGWVEQDPKEILSSQFTTLRKVLQLVPKNRPIAALGVANQRSTLVLWRRRDGVPIGPALSWQDRRNSVLCDSMQSEATKIRRRTGLRLSPHYAASKLSWLLQEHRSLYRGLKDKDLLCGTVNSFLIWHLTGGKAYLTDHTNAARMLLFNLAQLRWDPYLLSLFGLPPSCLPDPKPTFSDFGTAKIGGRQIPIRCSMGDQQASLLGQGCRREGEANINFGTGGFFLLHTGEKRKVRPGLLTSIASSNSNEASYLLEGTVNAVGSLLDWSKRLVGFQETASIDKHCNRSVHGTSSHLFLIPSLMGLGAPHWRDQIPSAMIGLSNTTKPQDLLKASVESIAFLMRDIYEAFGTLPTKKILVSGGVAMSNYLLQYQANLLQLPLFRSLESEASAKGTAMGAAIGEGILQEKSIHPAENGIWFHPKITRRQADLRYQEWQRVLTLILKEWNG